MLRGRRMQAARFGLGRTFVFVLAVATAGCSSTHGARRSGAPGADDPPIADGHAGGSGAASGSGGQGGTATAGSSAASAAGSSSVDVGKAGSSSGTGSSGEAGSASSGSGGAPAQSIIPLKDGVPIGDCVESTPEHQAAKGCPETEPAPSSGCFVDPDVECRYGISVEGGLSSQTIFSCDRGTWDPGARVYCGQSCAAQAVSGEHAIDFAVGSCPERPLSECDDGKGTMYAFDPGALTLTTAMLQSAVEACNASFSGNAVTLELENGCPKRLSSRLELDAAATTCLADRLGTARWKCATPLPCASYSWVLATAE